MNLLIVDDQVSVINGLKAGVHFDRLGIGEVFSADNARSAREILRRHPIELILCDIEMPGENGLELNQWIAEHYPETIRILLTSHTDFTYAQQSIKLGCFDYIVQPAPYDEIEASLRRAVSRLLTEKQNKRLLDFGKFYTDNEPELLERIIFNLYSAQEGTVNHAVEQLNQMGYPISGQSMIQILIIDVTEESTTAETASASNNMFKHIRTCLPDLKADSSVYSLLTRNKYHQFVLLLFCNDDSLPGWEDAVYQQFYRNISALLGAGIACYVGSYCSLSTLREAVGKLHKVIDDNVNRKSGLYFVTRNSFSGDLPDFSEYLKRWTLLLENGQFDTLCANIISHIDFIFSVSKANFKGLCELHQQLTQMFFNYSYTNGIDIAKLFTEAYKYTDYMDSFKNVRALKESVRFITAALSGAADDMGSQNDVQRAKNYILNNIARNISVKDVADYVHLSPEYFTKLFKKETGQNIKNYILQVKIDIAKDLLNNPNIPISLISLELGYTNFSHFTQMFKKYENLTPSEYRKKLTGIDDEK